MNFFFNEDDQVTGGSATFSRVASAADIELHAFLYTGRYVDGYSFFAVHSSFAFTGRTGCNGLHLTEEGVSHPSYLAAAATGAAGLNASFVLGTAAMTHIASDIFFYLDVFGNTFGDFFIIQLQFNPQVTASHTAHSLAGSSSLCASAAKETSKNILAENISELAKDIVH